MTTIRDLILAAVEQKRTYIGYVELELDNYKRQLLENPQSLLDAPLPEGATYSAGGYFSFLRLPVDAHLGELMPPITEVVGDFDWTFRPEFRKKIVDIRLPCGPMEISVALAPCKTVQVRVPEKIESRTICGNIPVDWDVVSEEEVVDVLEK